MQKIVIAFATIALLAIIAGWLTLNTKLSTAENAAGTIDMNAISTNMNTTATTTQMNAADMNAATTDMNATTMNATSVADKFPRSGLVPSRLDPKEIIFCPVLSDRSPRGECDYYNQMLANLAAGSGAVDYPKTMTRGETQTVSFVASKDQNPTEITELLGTQPAKIVALKVGRRMAVVLEGDGFTIHPPGLQERDLFLGKGTRWDWQVTAVKAQRYRLMLSAYVVVPAADGSNKESLLKTLELPLKVTVTWGQWFDDFVTSSTERLNSSTALVKALTLFVTAVFAFFGALGIRAAWRKWRPRGK